MTENQEIEPGEIINRLMRIEAMLNVLVPKPEKSGLLEVIAEATGGTHSLRGKSGRWPRRSEARQRLPASQFQIWRER